MNRTVKKYFWSLSDRGLERTAQALRDPTARRFWSQAITLLSLCDKPRELFRAIPRDVFMQHWPSLKRRWKKSGQSQTNLHWWDSIYLTLVSKEKKVTPEKRSAYLQFIGRQIRKARLEKKWSQVDLAERVNIEQRLISRVETGKANITMETLLKLAKTLGIEKIDLGLKPK